MKKFLSALCVFTALCGFAGCGSSEAEDALIKADRPGIFIEPSGPNRGAGFSVTLPESGLTSTVVGSPVVPEGDFIGTEVMEANADGELQRFVLQVDVDAKAGSQIYEYSARATGRRFFLLIGDRAVGWLLIRNPIRSTRLYFELDTRPGTRAEQFKEANAISLRLNTVIAKIRQRKEDEK